MNERPIRAMADTADQNLDELKRRGRRRLIGAIVLALVAAVVVPMLLESDPKPLGEDVSVRIPPVDDGKFVGKLNGAAPKKSLADAERSVLTPGARPAPAADAKAEQRTEAKAEPQAEPTSASPAPAAPPPAKPAATAPASTAPVAATASGKAASGKAVDPPPAAARADAPKDAGYAVQLAAFSDDKGANALAAKLKRAGYPAFTETLSTSRGTLWRVRVGPYPARDAAAQARDRLKGEGHAGIVVPSK